MSTLEKIGYRKNICVYPPKRSKVIYNPLPLLIFKWHALFLNCFDIPIGCHS